MRKIAATAFILSVILLLAACNNQQPSYPQLDDYMPDIEETPIETDTEAVQDNASDS